jgi:hypothetical protein
MADQPADRRLHARRRTMTDENAANRPYRRAVLTLALLASVALIAVAPATAQDRQPDPLATAQQLRKNGATAAAVARTLGADLRVTALTATSVLRSVGYDLTEITGAVRVEYVLNPYDLYDLLKKSGYPSTTIDEALDRNGVRLDRSCIDAQGYPLSFLTSMIQVFSPA